jgi:capsular exopolysaccharide synthesis family protein
MSTAHALPLDDSRRPDGPVLLPMPPRPPAGRGPNTAQGDAAEFSARDVLNALRYHLILFLFLGTLAAAGAAYAGWSLFPAKYTSYALLRVYSIEQAVADKNPNGTSRTEFGTYLSTQASLMKSHTVLNRALRQDVGGGQLMVNLPMIQSADDPISMLDEKVLIEFSDKSEIMKVSLTGDDPVQVTGVVNSIVDSFMKEVETYKRFQQARYDKLLTEKNEQEKALADGLKSYQDQYRKPGENEAAIKSHETRLRQWLTLTGEQSQIKRDLKRVRDQLALAQAREKERQQQPAQEIVAPELAALVDNDPAVQKKIDDIKRIENYVSYYRRTHSDAEEHVGEYSRKLQKEQSDLEELKKQTRNRLTQMYMEQARREIARGSGMLDGPQEVIKLARDEERLQIEERNCKEELAKYGDLLAEEAAKEPPPEKTLMLEKLRVLQERVGRLNMLADEQRTELKADERVQLYEKASVPQHKEIKKQLVFTGAGGLGGLFFVGALITLSEMRTKRVYSHRDPLFAQLPLLGRIPEHGFVAPSDGADPAPDDTAGLAFREAIDRTKTLTLRQMANKKLRTLLVTSPQPDEGKSILAWNLAAGFARNDLRVLFIDANLLRPSVHEHLHIAAPSGLSEILRGEQTLKDCTVETPVPNLFCLAAGQPDNEARRSLDRPAFNRLLDKARSVFDYVVIDTCSLSEAADPLCVAQRVDAAVLSLRTFRSRTPSADEALKRLQLLGTPVLGIVLTDPTLKESEL